MEYTSILTYLQDKYLFYVFEFAIFLIFLIGLIKEFRNRNSGRELKSGEKRREILEDFLSLILGIGIIELTINTAGDYKILFVTLNSLIFVYLTFFNSWIRNAIVGLYIKFESKIEKH